MATMTVGAASLQALGGFCLRRPAQSGAPQPRGSRILRGSVEAGTFEKSFFTPPAPGETDRILRAARKALDKAYQELLACLLEEAVLDPNQDSSATLSRVRNIFTKYT